jgi:nucleolar protein TMA23
MDAHALLTSQGWRGTGNSLHPTNNNVGLSRPLLVSRKDNTLGVGKKQHRTSDMWWMNAFDSSLKGLDTSKQGTVVQTITSGGLDMVKKGGSKFVGTAAGGGLYASFVRGESLCGTITPAETNDSTPAATEAEIAEKPEAKRNREKGEKESKERRRARKAAKRVARAKKAMIEEAETDKKEENEDTIATKPETKEERKERRRLKKLAREAEQKYVEASCEKAKKKKRRKE